MKLQYLVTITKTIETMKANLSILENFEAWVVSRETYRLPFIAGMLMFQTCIMVPLSLYLMRAAGGGDIQLGIIVCFSMLVVTLNLAAQPTKITIPVFVISTIVLILMTIINVFTVLSV